MIVLCISGFFSTDTINDSQYPGNPGHVNRQSQSFKPLLWNSKIRSEISCHSRSSAWSSHC